MKFKSILLSSILALGCATVSAQEAKTENVFNPHWYIQLQAGGQYTLGEIGFKDLLSPNAQIGIGYNFNKVVGARLSANAWQSKAGQEAAGTEYKWKWNYVAPMVDATFNLTNLFCKYDPNRVVTVGVFGGLGANIAWGNDEAADANKAMSTTYKDANVDALAYLWDGTKTRFAARVGANVDFRVSDRVSLGLEVSASTLNDHYNSKRAGNPDWYFNALAGVKVALGKTHTTRKVEQPAPVERIIERIVEKPVPVQPAPEVKKEVAPVETEMRRDIFFTIGNNVIAASEESKVNDIVKFLKDNPTAKVNVTGYADKGTGSKAINDRIAAKRAQTVVNALVNKGIAKDRITKSSKGDSVQPFAANDENRVTICIAK